MNSVNVLAKHGAVASLKDTAGQAEVKKKITDLRNKTTRELEAWGYPVIPSQTNFFMVSLHDSTVQPTITGVPREGRARRPSVPADAEPPARVGGPRRGDGQVPRDLQGDLPEEGSRRVDGARLVSPTLGLSTGRRTSAGPLSVR